MVDRIASYMGASFPFFSGRDTLDKDRPCLSSGGQWIVIMIMSAANTDTDILPESLPESGLIVFRAATYHEK